MAPLMQCWPILTSVWFAFGTTCWVRTADCVYSTEYVDVVVGRLVSEWERNGADVHIYRSTQLLANWFSEEGRNQDTPSLRYTAELLVVQWSERKGVFLVKWMAIDPFKICHKGDSLLVTLRILTEKAFPVLLKYLPPSCVYADLGDRRSANCVVTVDPCRPDLPSLAPLLSTHTPWPVLPRAEQWLHITTAWNTSLPLLFARELKLLVM